MAKPVKFKVGSDNNMNNQNKDFFSEQKELFFNELNNFFNNLSIGKKAILIWLFFIVIPCFIISSIVSNNSSNNITKQETKEVNRVDNQLTVLASIRTSGAENDVDFEIKYYRDRINEYRKDAAKKAISLGRKYELKGDFKKALDVYEEAKALDPENTDAENAIEQLKGNIKRFEK